MLKRIALYPGTFDPVTNGHLDIIFRASSLCDILIIGVAENIGKNPFFKISQRKSLIQDAISQNLKTSKRKLGEIRVESFDNLLIDFARDNSATMIIRGLRAVSDFDYEFQMAGMNARVANDIERNYSNLSNKLSIVRGTADNLDISTGQADLLICNGVLHGNGQNYNDFKKSLKEFNRVLKIGGTVYIGELPDVDEMKGKNYGNSLLQWLIYLKKERGLNDFIDGLKTILKSIFGSEPFIFVPKYMFFIERKQLGKVLKAYGFKIISEKRHQEITHEGKEIQSNTRWNYVAVKSKNVN